MHVWQSAVDVNLHIAFLQAQLHHLQCLAHENVPINLRAHKLRAPDLRVIQKRFDERFHTLREAHQRLEFLLSVTVKLLAVTLDEHVRIVMDAAQRLFQVVRGNKGKRIQLVVAAFKLRVEFRQLFRLPPDDLKNRTTKGARGVYLTAVSYTHLTLPTSDLV